jgi:hypothetical protein
LTLLPAASAAVVKIDIDKISTVVMTRALTHVLSGIEGVAPEKPTDS